VAGVWVSESNNVASAILKSMQTTIEPGVSFYVDWEVIWGVADDMSRFAFVDKLVDGCQGDNLEA